MKRIARSLHNLWRAESLLGTIRLAGLMKKAGLVGFAVLVAVFGVAMLDVAAYFALVPRWGQSGAALAVGLGNFVVALALLAIAQSVKPGAETDMLIEVRDMALADLEAEVAAMEDVVTRARKDLHEIVRHPFSSLAPGVLLPVLRSVVGSLRSARESE